MPFLGHRCDGSNVTMQNISRQGWTKLLKTKYKNTRTLNLGYPSLVSDATVLKVAIQNTWTGMNNASKDVKQILGQG